MDKMWSEQTTDERVDTSISVTERKIKNLFPEGIPMDLREKDFAKYMLWQQLELQLAILNAIKR